MLKKPRAWHAPHWRNTIGMHYNAESDKARKEDRALLERRRRVGYALQGAQPSLKCETLSRARAYIRQDMVAGIPQDAYILKRG